MINIISNSYLSRHISGPKKVARNLIKGLDLIGYPYVVNRRLDACKRLWIHDDLRALEQIHRLGPEIKIIVGPNLVVLPRHLPPDVDFSRVVYLVPSHWTKAFWEDFGLRACPIEVWPTGIDTNEFIPLQGDKAEVLVYFKQRLPDELAYAEQLLQQKRIHYRVLRYPGYSEENYKQLLSKARYMFWIGRQESQGIALQEAMSCDVPILVWDVTHMGHWLGGEREMKTLFNEAENNYANATSAEYFDETCGVKVKDRQELSDSVNRMESQWQRFRPRKYVLDHLSLDKQARDFIEFYLKHFGLTFEQGMTEHFFHKGPWINSTLSAHLNSLFIEARTIASRLVRRI